MQLTVLGAGSSAGTPVIGCRCATCTSLNPRNQRTRCSAAITLPQGQVILIDTGPDLRQQALREAMNRVDAVLYTHTHADHLHGMDDLRAFCQLRRQPIALYASAVHGAVIRERFGYALRDAGMNWDLPVLTLQAFDGPFEISGVTVTPIQAQHGRSPVYGFRIGALAWMTDVSEIPDEALGQLQGLDVLFISALRYQPHHTHINLEQSLKYARHIKARQTWLIHMTHELEYETVSTELPDGVAMAYDGLRVSFD